MKFEEILGTLMPYIVSALIAVLVYVKVYFDAKKIKDKVASLEDLIHNSDEEYYVICPSCGNQLELSKLKIYAKKRSTEEQDDDNN